MSERLRIGLLLDGEEVPAWAFAMIADIVNSDWAELALVVENSAGDHAQEGGRWRRRWQARAQALYHLYMRYERRFVLNPDAFEATSLGPLIAGVPTLRVTPRQTRHSDYVSDEDVAQIQAHRPDVLIRLGFRILRGKILGSARYGVWSFHHGDHDGYRGGPPGFWEVFERNPVTGAMLQVLTEDLDNGRILARTYSATHPISVRLNRNSSYWKALALVPRNLEHLAGTGSLPAPDASSESGLQFYSKRLYTTPTNREFALPLMRHGAHRIGRALRARLTWDQWILLFDFRDEMSTSLWRYKRLIPPPDRFWADPQIVHRDDRYFVFFEEFLYRSKKGRIAVFELREDGTHTEPHVALERPYHLSYPSLFTWQGQLYMVPESADHRTIEVYRCLTFPHQWQHETTLMHDVLAVDPTLVEHEGRWWLFANIQERPGASPSEELFAFHAPHPLHSQWEPHEGNPIISDVRSARPAGPFLRRNGRLYRPSQDCSRGYGHALRLSRVDTLSPTTYSDVEVSSIAPAWDRRITAVHSLAHAGRLTMVDAQYRWNRFARRRR